VLAAVGNFVGARLGGWVAKTVGDGMVDLPPTIPSLGVVFRRGPRCDRLEP